MLLWYLVEQTMAWPQLTIDQNSDSAHTWWHHCRMTLALTLRSPSQQWGNICLPFWTKGLELLCWRGLLLVSVLLRHGNSLCWLLLAENDTTLRLLLPALPLVTLNQLLINVNVDNSSCGKHIIQDDDINFINQCRILKQVESGMVTCRLRICAVFRWQLARVWIQRDV